MSYSIKTLVGVSLSVTGLGLGLGLGFGAPVASAHKGATGVVKERMVAMKDMGHGMKSIGLMIAGRKPYDAHVVKDAAKMIRAHAMKIPKLFPKGTGEKPSVAKQEIWKDFKDFEANAQRLAMFAHALQDGAGNGKTLQGVKLTPAALADPEMLKKMPPKIIFAQMAKTCSACHETYRKEKKK